MRARSLAEGRGNERISWVMRTWYGFTVARLSSVPATGRWKSSAQDLCHRSAGPGPRGKRDHARGALASDTRPTGRVVRPDPRHGASAQDTDTAIEALREKRESRIAHWLSTAALSIRKASPSFAPVFRTAMRVRYCKNPNGVLPNKVCDVVAEDS
jgi:hypothetical protein